MFQERERGPAIQETLTQDFSQIILTLILSAVQQQHDKNPSDYRGDTYSVDTMVLHI